MKRWLFLLVCVASMSVMAKPKEVTYVYMDKAQEAYQNDDIDMALEWVGKELTVNPYDAVASVFQAVMYKEQEKYAQAVDVLTGAIDHYKKNGKISLAELYQYRAAIAYRSLADESLMREDNWQTRLMAKDVARLEKIAGKDAEIWSFVASYFEMTDDAARAAQLYYKAFRYDVKDSKNNYHIEAANQWISIGRYAEAEKVLNEGLKRNPASETTMDALSRLYKKVGMEKAIEVQLLKYDLLGREADMGWLNNQAEENEHDVVRLIKKRTEVDNTKEMMKWGELLVNYLMLQEKYDWALEEIFELEVAEKSFNMIMRKATCFGGLEMIEEQIQALDEALLYADEDKDLANCYEKRGDAHMTLQDVEAAKEDYSMALKYEEDYSLSYKLGDLYNADGQFKEAIVVYTAGMEEDLQYTRHLLEFFGEEATDSALCVMVNKDTRYQAALISCARAYLYTNQPEKAYAMAQQLIDMHEAAGDSLALYTYYMFAIQQNEEKVEEYIRTQADDEDFWPYYNAACMYALMDKKAEAIEYLRKAFKMGFDNLDYLKTDMDLYRLWEMAEYKELIDSIRKGE